jgi:hypothetical protein
MNVYIVTEGEYSDKGIRGVFLSEEKAKEYQKLCPNANEWIEEYDKLDDIDCVPIHYVDVQYFLYDVPTYVDNRYYFKLMKSNSIDNNPKLIKRNSYYCHQTPYICFSRQITSNNYDEDILKSKYLKVCEDIKAEIESLKEIEGWDDEMIKEWFENKQQIIPDNE